MPNEMNHAEIAKKLLYLDSNIESDEDVYVLALAATDERKIANGELVPAPAKCAECTLHDHCKTEEIFIFSRLSENKRFCGVGWRKDGEPHE